MAHVPSAAMAHTSLSASIDIPKGRAHVAANATFSAAPKQGAGLLTPPNSISPNMPAHVANNLKSPPLLNIVEEDAESDRDRDGAQAATPPDDSAAAATGTGMPLSKGALSGLDARATITPALLAKDFLPRIMLGNGPRPIRHVMGELTHTVPGFSRIPPAKARRLVVAALEGRAGGGHDGSVAFCKTGWGRWDAHVKRSRDSAVGSLNEAHHSPPRSEHSGYALSYNDSGVHMPGPAPPDLYRGHSGESWTNSTGLREEDELEDMDMDVPENEADKMSLDEELGSSSQEEDDEGDATDDDDWAAVGPQALRKASLPAPGQPAPPRRNYQALGIPIARPSNGHRDRRLSAMNDRAPQGVFASSYSPRLGPMHPSVQSPEEQLAIEALLRMGSV